MKILAKFINIHTVIVFTSVFGLTLLSPTDVRADEAKQAASFSRGAKLWSENCASCHNMRGSNELRDDQWRVVVSHMRVRSGLSGQQARDILAFLQGSN